MTAELKQSEGSIRVAAEHTILTHTEMVHYSVRRFDWQRLYRSLKECDVTGGVNFYSNAGWASAGAATGALLAAIALYASGESAKVPDWVKAMTWSMLGVTTVLAIVLLLMARDKAKDGRRAVIQIAKDMEELETQFQSGRQVDNK